ncbi:polyprenyl synthetase family protein [Roseibium sp. MMSF_3544]|uniref:polyprenyl synthetase family protein n=1 Tax=unclassified Roseibium TaxID=2629323 RepID=UPI00273E06B3|nr:polyprenyl synthetase family protein [Roseibium sp. MMSF_3544]
MIDEEIDYKSEKAEVRDSVEHYLEQRFLRYPDTEVRQVAQYVALGGGHRWRPIVAVASGRIFHRDALKIGLPGACGVELAHAASLILDDLPSMDDAALRRGKPCAHLVFPRWAVDMAPVFLVTMAYDISLNNERVPEERRVRAALSLSSAGLAMIEGQCLDLASDVLDGSSDGLLDCYTLKSAALYGAAARAGAIICGADHEDADRLERTGHYLGLSYQFMDDVADVTATADQVGKEVGKDLGKFTSTDWLGVNGAVEKSRTYQTLALKELKKFGPEADWLRSIVCEASWATH